MNFYRTKPGCPTGVRAAAAAGDNLAALPLAMAYVPIQQWTQTYDTGVALMRGTIFPELDLPFMGAGGACV